MPKINKGLKCRKKNQNRAKNRAKIPKNGKIELDFEPKSPKKGENGSIWPVFGSKTPKIGEFEPILAQKPQNVGDFEPKWLDFGSIYPKFGLN